MLGMTKSKKWLDFLRFTNGGIIRSSSRAFLSSAYPETKVFEDAN